MDVSLKYFVIVLQQTTSLQPSDRFIILSNGILAQFVDKKPGKDGFARTKCSLNAEYALIMFYLVNELPEDRCIQDPATCIWIILRNIDLFPNIFLQVRQENPLLFYKCLSLPGNVDTVAGRT